MTTAARFAILIPARYASTRYPGKPLVPLRARDGSVKPLIQRTWDAARTVPGAAQVAVVTDDDRIADVSRGFGADVIMTSPDCANGTERCAEAVAALDPGIEIVVNMQGDAPLTPEWFVTPLVDALAADTEAAAATPVLRCDGAALAAFRAERAAGRVGGTTAVFAADKSALYFSKEVVPFGAPDAPDDAPTPVFHHVGVYAYRPDALAAYAAAPQGPLERLEGLEQLRFLETGQTLRCVEVEARGVAFWELNNPEDVERIEAAFGVQQT